MAVAGKLSKLSVSLDRALQGGGLNLTVTVRKGGTTDTAVGCTISGAATSCTDSEHTVEFAEGEIFTIKIASSGSPATSEMRWNAVYAS